MDILVTVVKNLDFNTEPCPRYIKISFHFLKLFPQNWILQMLNGNIVCLFSLHEEPA